MMRRTPPPSLTEAFDQCAGQWVAADRQTGHVVAARSSAPELSAFLRQKDIRGVDVLRVPDSSDPELVGLG